MARLEQPEALPLNVAESHLSPHLHTSTPPSTPPFIHGMQARPRGTLIPLHTPAPLTPFLISLLHAQGLQACLGVSARNTGLDAAASPSHSPSHPFASRITQGLQACLGVSARNTGRATNFAQFIRTGSHEARVQVWMK